MPASHSTSECRYTSDGTTFCIRSNRPPPNRHESIIGLDEIGLHGAGSDLLLVTFGNGVHLSRRAAAILAGHGIDVTVLDLRWLAPLPVDALNEVARLFDSVLVVDETRRSGGVSEGVVTALVDGGHRGRIARVTSADSFIPLGPAADEVLLSEDDIVAAAADLHAGGI